VDQEFWMFLGWSHSNFWGTSKTCSFSSPATRNFISNMERSSQQLMEIYFIHTDSRKHIPLQKECNTWYGCGMEICSCKNLSLEDYELERFDFQHYPDLPGWVGSSLHDFQSSLNLGFSFLLVCGFLMWVSHLVPHLVDKSLIFSRS
jgi:hypothetical protein